MLRKSRIRLSDRAGRANVTPWFRPQHDPKDQSSPGPCFGSTSVVTMQHLGQRAAEKDEPLTGVPVLSALG